MRVQNNVANVGDEIRRHEVINEEEECVEDSPSWDSLLLKEIGSYKYEVDVDAGAICPGLPTESVRGWIDDDFSAWLNVSQIRRADEVRAQQRSVRPDDDPAVSTHAMGGAEGVRRSSTPNRPANRHRTSDRAKKRRADYARVQDLFRKNKSRCAQRVLDGTWSADRPGLSLPELEPFWRKVFEKESVFDCRRPEPIGPVIWEVVNPVTLPELEQTIAEMKPGAPGPDGMVLREFKKLSRVALKARYNLWLLAGYCPTLSCKGVTVLISKDLNDLAPPKHRPITMADLIIRCFHKLLAKRLGAFLPFSDRQKAFRKGDGLAENVLLLNAIIDSHKKTLTPLNVVFLDIKKAFDSVSHDTILIAAERMGVPPPFINYLREYYVRSTTVIRVGGRKGDPITVRQGVKQGDPMSVHLFNAVIDWALADLDPELGINIQGERINHLAFADDIVLFTRTSIAAQNQLNRLTSHLELAGLRISAGELGKSASIRIDIDGKKKKWVVNPSAHLHVAGETIPARTISQVYKYLGINFSAKGTACDMRVKLQSWLDNISMAPLKPQQRMYMLRVHVIPSLFHQLVLARTTTGQLRFLDLKIRGAVKDWLKLPKDTVNPYFYAATRDGGLGVTNLRFTIPLMRKSRLEGIVCSSDPAIAAVALTPFVRDALVKLSVPQTLGTAVIVDKRSLERAYGSALHATVDGFGLSSCSLVPQLHSWVKTPGPLISGANYIGAIKIRGNLMPSAARTSRGRPLASHHPAF